MKKTKVLIFTLLLLYGCTTVTQITNPNGDTYTVKSKSDALVAMKSDNIEITVDNRGKPNVFESLLGWLLLKTPDVVEAN